MRHLLHTLPLWLLVACAESSSTDTDDTDTDDTNTTGGTDFGELEFDARGTFTGFTPGADFASTVWAPEQAVIAPGTVNVDAVVNDFQEEEPRSGRTAAFWYGDVVTGSADVTQTTDSEGAITFANTPSCQPMTYLTKELPGLNEARDTYKAHQIYGPGTGGTIAAELSSVSNDTYNLIPTVLGIPVDASKGVVAGTVYDVTRDPDTLPSDDTGKVEGVRVRVRGCPAAGADPADCTTALSGLEVRYFFDSFPSRDQRWTSPDGLYGVYGVPPGTVLVEAYGLIGGEEVVLGASVVTTYADSINVANIWSGYPDGVKYPAACLDET